MKKFKLFLLAVVALCMGLCFSGCAKDAKLVKDSFNYTVTQGSGCQVTFDFEMKVPEDEYFIVYYYLTGKTGEGTTVMTLTEKQYIGSSAYGSSGNHILVKDTLSFGSYVEDDSVKLKVKAVRMKEHKVDQAYIALGFGIFGVLVIGACITLFVLDKKGIIGKKKK